MRRRLLVCLAICAALGALVPEPAPARSLLGLLFGARVHRGHHHHYAYHHHHFHPHYARHWGASRWRYARRSPAPAAVAGGIGAAAAPAIAAPATPPPASVYWPAAYQDLAGFTFASGGTDNAFWSHGFRDVFAGVIVPPGATGGADAQSCAATNADAADAGFKKSRTGSRSRRSNAPRSTTCTMRWCEHWRASMRPARRRLPPLRRPSV